jgi:hypothetical protein
MAPALEATDKRDSQHKAIKNPGAAKMPWGFLLPPRRMLKDQGAKMEFVTWRDE